ncbi:glutamate ABC transporter substrate-binding protein [Streptomyces sp. AJS327]|uniref:glutamate ABC transporter substrate-binding protein n=1 Tax=Streptomyces sp. AJS327 TaxID=2545265 RepID=UPI0027E586E3|nr:glutamate ABC transporter substrate-binding protein [Streptomyces sp. AJS327]
MSLLVAVAGLALVAGVLGVTLRAAPGPAVADAEGAGERLSASGESGATAPEEPRNPGDGGSSGGEGCREGVEGARAVASLKPSRKAGRAVKRVRKAERLVVGVDQDSYLWGYRDPASGRLRGFDIDLVEAIAEDLLGGDPEIVYRPVPTERRVAAIRDREVDMVVRTMTISCDRRDDVAFSTAYFEAGQQLVAPKEGARVKGFDGSLRGERLCYARGSTAEKLMRTRKVRALGARSVTVPNQLDCLVRMQLGTVDATVTDSALGAGQAAQDPSVELVGEPATVEPYGVAMNPADRDLVRRVNRVLEEYRKGGADSAWRSSYREWLADEMMGTEDGKEPSPPKPVYGD